MKKYLVLLLILGILGVSSVSALTIKSNGNGIFTNNSCSSKTTASVSCNNNNNTCSGSSVEGTAIDEILNNANGNSDTSCTKGSCNADVSCINGNCSADNSCITGECNSGNTCVTGNCNSNTSCNAGQNVLNNASENNSSAPETVQEASAAAQDENTTQSQCTSNTSVSQDASKVTSNTSSGCSNNNCPDYSCIFSGSNCNNYNNCNNGCPNIQDIASILGITNCPYSQNQNSSQNQSSETPAESSSQEDSSQVTSGNGTSSNLANEVLAIVNKERTSRGLNALTLNTSVQSAAQTRAVEIVSSFSHTRPNGTSCFTALKENSVSYRGAGENIAMGQTSAEQVMNSWMNSSGHRANILNADYTQIGIGVYKAADGRYYWTQMFIY